MTQIWLEKMKESTNPKIPLHNIHLPGYQRIHFISSHRHDNVNRSIDRIVVWSIVLGRNHSVAIGHQSCHLTREGSPLHQGHLEGVHARCVQCLDESVNFLHAARDDVVAVFAGGFVVESLLLQLRGEDFGDGWLESSGDLSSCEFFLLGHLGGCG